MPPKRIEAFCRDIKEIVGVIINTESLSTGYPTLRDVGLLVQCSRRCSFCNGIGKVIGSERSPFLNDGNPTPIIIKAKKE